MGNIRTPKPVYFKNGVMIFFVKNKEIFYNIWKWSDDGITQYLYHTGKYQSNEQIKLVIAEASQSFSSVGVIEN